MTINIMGIIFEDFINYKKPSMVVEFPKCDFKCGIKYCQNYALAKEKIIEADIQHIVEYYIKNPITEAIVFQGLEPFDTYEDMYHLIKALREQTNDDIVIFTGYNFDEIKLLVKNIHDNFDNIIIKFGRYLPNQQPHYDKVLGVNLASDNQYAINIGDLFKDGE